MAGACGAQIAVVVSADTDTMDQCYRHRYGPDKPLTTSNAERRRPKSSSASVEVAYGWHSTRWDPSSYAHLGNTATEKLPVVGGGGAGDNDDEKRAPRVLYSGSIRQTVFDVGKLASAAFAAAEVRYL